MEQVHHFEKGKLYIIVNKECQKALKIEETVVDSRIIGDQVDPDNQNQLWFIQEVQPNDYEITNAVTGYCFDEQDGQIRIEKGKKASDQLFYVQKACKISYTTYYWIKTSKKSKRALSFDGYILKYGAFDPQDQHQMFRFDHVPTNDTLKKASIIENSKSQKVIDIYKIKKQQATKLVQSHRTKKFNQRWELRKTAPTVYAFINLMTGYAISINSDAEQDSKIIQLPFQQNPFQLWKLEKKQHGLFLIKSLMNPNLLLGVQNDGVKNGDELRLVSYQTKWKFEGFIPFD